MTAEAIRFSAVASTPHPEKTLKINALAGGPADSTLPLWNLGESPQTGTWECSPGVFPTSREGMNEVIYILEGNGFLLSQSGEQIDYSVGDVVVIPDGYRGEWHVMTLTRKLYFGVRAD